MKKTGQERIESPFEAVKRRCGLERDLAARRAVRATLEVLGLHLDRETARSIAAELPPDCADWLTGGGDHRRLGIDELYREVAAREEVSPGFAMEHTQVVTGALLDLLGDEGRRRLLAGIPELLAARLASWVETAPLPASEPRYRPAGRRTLASARPGSSRPLSEAAPGQRESVARSDDPRGDSRLSSSRGEPRGRSKPISTGRPGSARPLSETED
jgi:uncharacterized protein (DUF2267 family)